VGFEVITLYTGTPGSGKSLLAITEALENWVSSGKPVYTNHPLRVGWESIWAMRSIYNRYFMSDERVQKLLREYRKSWIMLRSFADIPRGRKKEGSRLLLLDEVSRFINARDYLSGRTTHRDEYDFFAQHRKQGYEVILLSQHPLQVDKQIRDLAEWNRICRNLSTFKIPLGFISLRIPFKVILTVTKDMRTGLDIDRGVTPIDPVVCRCYDTLATFTDLFATDEDVKNEVDPVQVAEEVIKNVWKY